MSGDWIATVILLTALALFLIERFLAVEATDERDGRWRVGARDTGNCCAFERSSDGIWPARRRSLGRGAAPAGRGRSGRGESSVCSHTSCSALDQLGLIRLVPGRTGRHYLQVVRDRELVDSLAATLRLFEDVYYGRKSTDDTGVRVGLESRLVISGTPAVAGSGSVAMRLALGTTRLMGCLGAFVLGLALGGCSQGPDRLLWQRAAGRA